MAPSNAQAPSQVGAREDAMIDSVGLLRCDWCGWRLREGEAGHEPIQRGQDVICAECKAAADA